MHADIVDRLSADLQLAAYTTDAVASLLGPEADEARSRGIFAPARRALDARPGSSLATLTRCFLLGEPVPSAELDAALPSARAAGLREIGVVVPADEPLEGVSRVRAALSLNPVRIAADEEWLVISDLDDQLRRGAARPDHVMGVGGATRSLIAQTPTTRVASALDLGTGCGIVALHATRYAARVVASDISERALRFAAMNARLNGVAERIEFRSGDLFAPVAGERFDLILSNPPFVITPRSGDAPVYEYRDGGLTGDALAQRVVEAAPGYLTAGGTVLCLANWESPWGANGLSRVGEWIETAAAQAGPLSAWVIERDRVAPSRYAETWVRDGGDRPGDEAFELRLGEWIDDFAARRITAVGLGSVRIQRLRAEPSVADTPSDGAERIATVVQLDSATGALAQSAELGDLLQRALETGAATARLSATAVLSTRWVRDAGVSETRVHEPGVEAPHRISLDTERPIARRVAADPLLAAALGACDGELRLEQIADALATILEVDAAAASDALVAGVRELAWFGMLAPAGAPDPAAAS